MMKVRVSAVLLACLISVGCRAQPDPGLAPVWSVYAGSQTEAGFRDGPRLAARFMNPNGLCRDRHGNILVADTGNQRIRKIDRDGNVSTIAGAGGRGVDIGPALKTKFFQAWDCAVDAEGNVYITDNGAIRRLRTDGIVETFASPPSGSYSLVLELKFSPEGHLFGADRNEKQLVRIDEGRFTAVSEMEAPPYSMAFGPEGRIYVGENMRILRQTRSGFEVYATGDGNSGGDGSKLSDVIGGLEFGPDGLLYAADEYLGIVRITQAGRLEVIGEDNFPAGASDLVFTDEGEMIVAVGQHGVLWRYGTSANHR